MNNKYKQPWIDALRSGKYKQGKDFLAIVDKDNEVKHCCLGVLCEINGLGDGETKSDLLHTKVYRFKSKMLGSDALLPKDFRNEVGLHEMDEMDLVRLNDNGQTFNEIADYIEERL